MKHNQQYFEINKEHWDLKAKHHVESKFYDVPGFKKGNTTLNKIELDEMPNVKDKSLLHLQCHFGMDSISFQRMGAEVTAIDLSPQSIAEANKLNAELNTNVKFIESNVLTIDQVLDKQFDIVFTSYGVICWLPELKTWAKQIEKHLKPGGIFYMVEFHPTLWIFDHETGEPAYSYFNHDKPYIEEVNGSYADIDPNLKSTECFWSHSMADVCTALLDTGLRLDFLHEHDYSPYNCFENFEKRENKQFVYKKNGIIIPSTFSLQCTKV